MSIIEEASAELNTLKNQFVNALKNFFNTYDSIRHDRKKVVNEIGALVEIQSKLVTRLNYWLSTLHREKDFTEDKSLAVDYLATSNNIVNSSFKFYDFLKEESPGISGPPASSFYVVQSFIKTFSKDDAYVQSLKQKFQERGISIEGFNHQFEETISRPGTRHSILKLLNMSIFNVIKEATKAVPFVKYALGIAGIAAAIALISTFGISNRVAVIGIIIMLVLMTILFLLAKTSQNDKSFFKGPATVLLWAIVILFIVSSFTLVSSIFFKYPQDLSDWLISKPVDSTKQSPAPVADAYKTIRGYVYSEKDNAPVAGATVIPSIHNHSSTITAENGSFQFTVKSSEISDTVLLTVRSVTFQGMKNAKFSKEKLDADCNIYVPQSPPVAVTTKVPVKTVTKKQQPAITQICNLIKPLRMYFSESATEHKLYTTNNYQFRDAEKLYKTNVAMIKHISKYSNLIPQALDKDFNLLIQHLNIWTRGFENMRNQKNPAPLDTFRVIYEGDGFPADSAERIKKYGNCN